MSTPLTDAGVKAVVRDTFNLAAERFDAEPLFFWDPFGRRTVALAPVRPGDRVVDVCCGTGASALPAAATAGPGGRVVGVDLAERLLDRARAKARERGLDNVVFRVGDLERLDVAPGAADAVLCVLGLYFARDPAAAVAGLWRAVGDGGRLAVTTWGRRALEPVHSYLLDAVAGVGPDLRGAVLSWERFNSTARLGAVFVEGGVPRPVIEEQTVVHPLTTADAWTIVLGSGYRVLLRGLTADGVARVRDGLWRRMERAGTREVVADVLYARAARV